MGVGVSGWRLANAVARTGQLGVVSGVALEVLLTRRLQDGDPGGDMRRALAAFPVPSIASWILDSYFVEGGIAPDAMYRQVPRYTLKPAKSLLQLTVVANFVEVFLAKEGHHGRVGINYLRKIELPIPAGCYGAMLAGVDYVLMGAGSPHELPGLIRDLAAHQPTRFGVKVLGARSDSGLDAVEFRPADVVPTEALPGDYASLPRPKAIAIVASTDLAAGLAGDPHTRPDGFVVEGPAAGGHNAPPRGPRRVDELGQPIYDERDEVEIADILALGMPVWLAGGQATPESLRAALELGATGIQVGTAFAYCNESGFDSGIKDTMHEQVRADDVQVIADWRCSPTGFPFRVAAVAGTLSDESVRAARQPVCDLAVLRSPYVNDEGKVDYRCPAEPEAAYLRKGGRAANMDGRVCLCNALFAAAGHPQRRPGGRVEPALVTSGSDLSPVKTLLAQGAGGYSAHDVINHLLGT